MNELYPFESHYLEINKHRLHYLDEGKGETLVMLHGNPTWSFYYRNLVLALRDSYRIIVPDHIGCGLSDKPDDSDGSYGYTLQRRVKDIEDLLWHLRIKENITLIVHDWGGMIGMTYAHKNPEAVKRFVIMNTSAFRLPKTKPFPWQLWLIRNTPFGSLLVQGLNAFCLGAAKYCAVKHPLSEEVKAQYLAPYDTWKNRLAVLRFVQDIPLKPSDPSYRTIIEVEDGLKQFANTPMLICWGEKDFIFDNHFLLGWINRFPKADVHTFRDAGHYVLEDAGKEIAQLVKNFLKDTPLPR